MGRLALVVLLSMAALAAAPATAEEMARGKVTLLVQPSEIGGVPGYELRAIHNDFAPGAGTPRHTHPGDQWTVVQLGEVTMILNDGAPKVMKVGEMVRIPAGTPHETYNRSSEPARTLEIFVLEKGKPNITMLPAK